VSWGHLRRSRGVQDPDPQAPEPVERVLTAVGDRAVVRAGDVLDVPRLPVRRGDRGHDHHARRGGRVAVGRSLFAPAGYDYLRYVDRFTNTSGAVRKVLVAWGATRLGRFDGGGPHVLR
jgi:hypothetical protein